MPGRLQGIPAFHHRSQRACPSGTCVHAPPLPLVGPSESRRGLCSSEVFPRLRIALPSLFWAPRSSAGQEGSQPNLGTLGAGPCPFPAEMLQRSEACADSYPFAPQERVGPSWQYLPLSQPPPCEGQASWHSSPWKTVSLLWQPGPYSAPDFSPSHPCTPSRTPLKPFPCLPSPALPQMAGCDIALGTEGHASIP